jgi:hypothetical protein
MAAFDVNALKKMLFNDSGKHGI